MYEAENELSGALFLKNHGLVHLTNVKFYLWRKRLSLRKAENVFENC